MTDNDNQGSIDTARSLGLDMRPFTGIDHFDVAIDGADQVDPAGWPVKGGGGAQTREKIVAAAATRYVVIVSSNKLVDAMAAHVPRQRGARGLLRSDRRPRRTGAVAVGDTQGGGARPVPARHGEGRPHRPGRPGAPSPTRRLTRRRWRGREAFRLPQGGSPPAGATLAEALPARSSQPREPVFEGAEHVCASGRLELSDRVVTAGHPHGHRARRVGRLHVVGGVAHDVDLVGAEPLVQAGGLFDGDAGQLPAGAGVGHDQRR